jgi:hypothetical protein
VAGLLFADIKAKSLPDHLNGFILENLGHSIIQIMHSVSGMQTGILKNKKR